MMLSGTIRRPAAGRLASLVFCLLILAAAYGSAGGIILPIQDRGFTLAVQEALGGGVEAGRQWAVFIAIDRYQEWPSLNNPVRDAREIRDILKAEYYIDEVRELYDREATAGNIRRLFDDLRRQTGQNDSVFVFYAGHGETDEVTKNSFRIPVDAGRDQYAQANWLPDIQVGNMLAALPARHVFMVFDSPFPGDILDTNREVPPAINSGCYRQAYSLVSRQVMTSGGAGESVPDSSEFALQLKNALSQAEGPCIDPEYLFMKNIREVRTTHPQLGSIKGSEHQQGGSFLFFRRVFTSADFTIEGTKLVKYTGTSETPVIPWGITEIGEDAFRNSTIRSVEIPASVTSIERSAFANCKNLTRVELSRGTQVADDAFASSPVQLYYRD